MKKLICKYTNPEHVLMVSPYPNKGELYSAGTTGIASYTKNVVTHMKNSVIVLTSYTKKHAIYEEDNNLIVRCFKINRSFMWIELFRTIRTFKAIKNIIIQYDFATYGDIATSALVIPFMLILRLLGYNISLVSHSVVLNVFELSGHIGLGTRLRDTLYGFFYNALFHLFYYLLNYVTTHVIVLEEPLQKKLSRLIFRKKLLTIAHGVDIQLKAINKKNARKKLGLPQNESIILFFGFINWFKGADFFASAFSKKQQLLGKNITCLIAGGSSPTMQSKKHYEKYFASVKKTVDRSASVSLTGYVPQAKIALYFSAADLVVLPYRYFMAASGVLSLLFSYQKPFIISEKLAEMFNSNDFKDALEKSSLQKNDLLFKMSTTSLLRKTEKVLENGLKRKMVKMTKLMRQSRKYELIARQYETLYSPNIAPQKGYTFALRNYDKQKYMATI